MAQPQERTGQPKVWVGDSWKQSVLRVWNGLFWEEREVKGRSATEWVVAK